LTIEFLASSNQQISKTANRKILQAGVAQLVEHNPSKVRAAGSNLVSRSIADVAQLVERFLGKEEVTGSNPVIGSRMKIF
jgi:hypothetical protein